ncbi:glycoside hydrolase family 43 protein [Saccharibacillus deserti]|uniref:glycoside hydrolase family 43 protein n=1 Tax=Saccharibacillus deserti TaxID=1634444 RepID=UPI001553DC0B|nr:glycoside hydrolase family 43 protein [Saccharibacillus deserti]
MKPTFHQPLVTHLYTADPSAHVFEGRIYIYPSHDLDHDEPSNDSGDQYKMEDYHVFSMSNTVSPVVDHGEVLHVRDVPWASRQMWAPDAAYRNGRYYLFFPARDHEGVFRIGVATSDSPAGPFRAEPHYIPGSFSIDPAVFIDDDNRAYLYFGGLWGGQLEKWRSGTFEPERVDGPAAGQPALGPRAARLSEDLLNFESPPREISIVDEGGAAITADDEERRYFEGPWMHKHRGLYYLSYSTGTTHKLVYATSEHPEGPFTYRGVILNPVIGWTTHHSIVEFEDKWYLFYHDSSLSKGVNHKRCIKFAELHYNEDGSIRTVL